MRYSIHKKSDLLALEKDLERRLEVAKYNREKKSKKDLTNELSFVTRELKAIRERLS